MLQPAGQFGWHPVGLPLINRVLQTAVASAEKHSRPSKMQRMWIDLNSTTFMLVRKLQVILPDAPHQLQHTRAIAIETGPVTAGIPLQVLGTAYYDMFPIISGSKTS